MTKKLQGLILAIMLCLLCVLWFYSDINKLIWKEWSPILFPNKTDQQLKTVVSVYNKALPAIDTAELKTGKGLNNFLDRLADEKISLIEQADRQLDWDLLIVAKTYYNESEGPKRVKIKDSLYNLRTQFLKKLDKESVLKLDSAMTYYGTFNWPPSK